MLVLFPFLTTSVDDPRRTLSVYYNPIEKKYTWKNDTYDPDAIARGIWEDHIEKYGWIDMHVESKRTYLDIYQAYATGYAEGIMSAEHFEAHYNNVMTSLCKEYLNDECKGTQLPMLLRKFFGDNLQWVKTNLSTIPSKPTNAWEWGATVFWNQFQGMYNGYNEVAKTKINELDFWIYQCRSEIYEAYRHVKVIPPDQEPILERRSSFMTTTSTQHSNMLISHNSMRSYSEALQISKRYRNSYSNNFCVVERKSFSSYPLMMHSDGGLTITDQALVIGSSSIALADATLMSKSSEFGWPHWFRELVATQIAHTSSDWAKVYIPAQSSVVGVQWAIIDLKRFDYGQDLLKNCITLVEEIPGLIKSSDITEVSEKRNYFGMYDVPFDEEIFNLAGYKKLEQTEPRLYSYDKCSRAKLIAKKALSINTRKDMKAFIMYNDPSDPIQENRADLGMAMRQETAPSKPVCRGTIGARVTSVSQALHLNWDGVSGAPLLGKVPFKFSNYDICKDIQHDEVPDELDNYWKGHYFDLDL